MLYGQELTTNINANPLEWWKMNKVDILVCLVLKYHVMPATRSHRRGFYRAIGLLCTAPTMLSKDVRLSVHPSVCPSVTRRYSKWVI